MKHSFFYHPLIKGFLLILFAVSLLASAFFGLRIVFMESNSVFDGPEHFYPSHITHYGDTLGLSMPDRWDLSVTVNDDIYHYAQDDLSYYLIRALQRATAEPTPETPIRDGDFVYLASAEAETSWLRTAYEKTQSNFVYRVEELQTGRVLFSNMEDLYESGEADGLLMSGSSFITVYDAGKMPQDTPMTEDTAVTAESDITTQNVTETEAPTEAVTEAVTAPAAADTAAVTEAGTLPLTEDTAALTQPTESAPMTADSVTAVVTDMPETESETESEKVQGTQYVYHWGVRRDFTANDAYSTFYLACENDYANARDIVLAALISVVVCIGSVALLLVGTGITPKKEEVQLSFIDRIPLEPVLFVKGAALWGVAALCVMLLDAAFGEVLYYLFGYLPYPDTQTAWITELYALGGIALILATGLLLLWPCAGLVRRIRAKTLFKNTLIAHILRLCLRVWRFVWRAVSAFFGNLSLYLQWTVLFAVLLLFSLIFGGGMAFVCALIVYFVVCYVLWQLARVRRGMKKIADGALDYHVDTQYMYGAPKTMAEDLNRIGEGMSRAVEARMRSERFRTELITNVSHDIKTPLTSIISYTDLLAKEEPENERMREYIEVLSRQSARLKKLTEDLIDASKASSGAVPVALTELDAAELLRQVLGEYEERLAEARLTPVLHVPEEGAYILADGRHLWRVFDNLMSNILKYSMSGTRVYLGAQSDDGGVHLTFKNISDRAIDIDAAELTERFVRGDASRHTEGSGLGLAIAKSLTELQGGTMRVLADADLFSVHITFSHPQR